MKYHITLRIILLFRNGNIGIEENRLNSFYLIIVVANYEYDNWGNHYGYEDQPNSIAYKNPFRYRGYIYDQETKLYYLQSRYYDSQTGRFLNADDSSILGFDQDSLVQYNLFAYCLNNPVMNSDPTGCLKVTWGGKWGNAWIQINFSYWDIVSFILAAAQLGPQAMMIALNAISYLMSGPVGVLFAILAIIGYPSIKSFCYTVVQAVSKKKGVYLKAGYNPWPYLKSGIA